VAASLLVTLLWRRREKSLTQLGEKLLLHFLQTLHPCRAAKPNLAKNQSNKEENHHPKIKGVKLPSGSKTKENTKNCATIAPKNP